MSRQKSITPCLWFDTQAEDAATHYVAIFPDSRITSVNRYAEAGREIHGRTPGSVMMVAFELDGQTFTALNGGPLFRINEAVSFQVGCAAQKDVDYYWERLGEGGDPAAQRCGWLKDRFGVSWQIVPDELPSIIGGPDNAGRERAMAALMQMGKLDIAALKHAYAGG